MLDNSLKIRAQQSDFLNISNESPRLSGYIKVAEDFGSENNIPSSKHGKEVGTVSPKPTTSQLHTEFDV